jgi:hypothetical protein
MARANRDGTFHEEPSQQGFSAGPDRRLETDTIVLAATPRRVLFQLCEIFSVVAAMPAGVVRKMVPKQGKYTSAIQPRRRQTWSAMNARPCRSTPSAAIPSCIARMMSLRWAVVGRDAMPGSNVQLRRRIPERRPYLREPLAISMAKIAQGVPAIRWSRTGLLAMLMRPLRKIQQHELRIDGVDLHGTVDQRTHAIVVADADRKAELGHGILLQAWSVV